MHEARPRPWQFLDAEELAKLKVFVIDLDRYWNVKYTYSAASVALRWLHSLPKATRDDIRKIALIEHRESIAFLESHGRGFIEICQDHPQLKVERVVSLWRTGFPMSKFGLDAHLRGDRDYIDRGLMEVQGCDAYFLTKGLGAWIMEASILPSLGMPDGSFTLVLDGEPLPEKTAAAFRVVQRDVAYQTALNACYARRLLPQPSWVARRLCTTGFMYEGLPEAVSAISMHSALIRTNFPLCGPYDVEKMLQERKGWTVEQWEWGWPTHEPRGFETEAPLPPWHYLRWQHVIE